MYLLFLVLSLILLATAIGVLAFRNPIYSAIALVINMMCIAGLFAMLDAHFLAVVQIIVYAGAVVVLFLFVVMLLNTKEESLSWRDSGALVGGVVAGALFLVSILPLFARAFKPVVEQSTSLFSEAPLTGTVENMGELLFTQYLFPFEAASILLMAALVGAVILGTGKKGKKLEIQSEVSQ